MSASVLPPSTVSDPSPPSSGALTGRPRPVVLVLPAHDEEASVAAVVARVPPEVRGHPTVVLVVDDGSTDATAVEAAGAGATVEAMGANQGLGAAIRRGLARSLEWEPVAVAFCDADGEYAPEELGSLVAPILDGHADYVVGSRFSTGERHMRPHRMVGNRTLTVVTRALARVPLTDGQSGYRAFSPAATRAADIIHDYNYAQVLTLDLVAKGFRYHEVPISYRFRRHGTSFVSLGTYLRRVVPAVRAQLRAQPIRRPARSADVPATTTTT